MEEHFKLGLSAAQSADIIARKLAQISQEYPPLRIENLPTMVIKKIGKCRIGGETNNLQKLESEKI